MCFPKRFHHFFGEAQAIFFSLCGLLLVFF